MKILIPCMLVILLASACNNNSREYGDNSETNLTKEFVEDSYAAKKEGYKKGYEDGYNDGYGWYHHGVNYNDRSNYKTDYAIRAYKNSYQDGYNEGYEEGETRNKAERERERLSDWHNWEKEDVNGLYIYLDGVENDDAAEYVAREQYEGEYIREGWQYFAKINHTWGNYNVTLGKRVNSKLYNIRGSDIYIHFRWLPDVSSGDEGVLDWSGTFSSFYKKPDNP